MTGLILLKEDFSEIEHITESNQSDGKKKYYIAGKFMQSQIPNKNGRFYPREVIEQQVNDYQNVISARRSLGELEHPPTPNINPERVSHMITELKMDGNDVYGKALVIEDLPMGKIVKTLLEANAQLGVSSRGLGTLRESKGVRIVQPDYKLKTVDIVSDPSGPNCFPEALVENIEWFYDGVSWQKKEMGIQIINEWKDQPKHLREETLLNAWNKLLKTF